MPEIPVTDDEGAHETTDPNLKTEVISCVTGQIYTGTSGDTDDLVAQAVHDDQVAELAVLQAYADAVNAEKNGAE